MKKIISAIIKFFNSNLTKIICSICDAIKALFSYKKSDLQNKIEERKIKKQKDFDNTVDEITKDGTIDDLLNIRKEIK